MGKLQSQQIGLRDKARMALVAGQHMGHRFDKSNLGREDIEKFWDAGLRAGTIVMHPGKTALQFTTEVSHKWTDCLSGPPHQLRFFEGEELPTCFLYDWVRERQDSQPVAIAVVQMHFEDGTEDSMRRLCATYTRVHGDQS